MRSNRGFTMIEIMMATAIFSVVMAAIFSLLSNSQRASQKAMIFTDRQANLSLMNRVLKKDGLGSKFSFGNIIATDDNGAGFFDYNPGCAGAACERTLTLDTAGEKLTLITTGFNPVPAAPYDPAKAYDTAQPATIDEPGTLTFHSLNKEGYLDAIAPDYWKKGNLLIFFSPNPVPAYDGSGNIDPGVAPRPLTYLGYVGEAGTSSRLLPALSGDFANKDPSGVDIPDEDSFLRRLEGMGGSSVLPLLQPVTALRYRLVNGTSGNGFNLIREAWGLNAQGNPAFLPNQSLILEGVKTVIFKRSSTAVTNFSFDIKMVLVTGQ